MRGIFWSLAFVVLIGAVTTLYARAADERQLSGDFRFFSGSLGESGSPKKDDVKLQLHFTGKLASDLYGYLGPKAKIDSCEPGEQTRSRGDLVCIRDAKDTRCWTGLNVMTGHTTNGIIC